MTLCIAGYPGRSDGLPQAMLAVALMADEAAICAIAAPRCMRRHMFAATA
ncbi:hypothetical protein [Paracoccus kondratievae]|nr:hypothetical protein [Paracoccus kondratievae]